MKPAASSRSPAARASRHGFVHQATVREPGGRPALQLGYTVRPELGRGALEQHARNIW